jgi:hypothetical protein
VSLLPIYIIFSVKQHCFVFPSLNDLNNIKFRAAREVDALLCFAFHQKGVCILLSIVRHGRKLDQRQGQFPVSFPKKHVSCIIIFSLSMQPHALLQIADVYQSYEKSSVLFSTTKYFVFLIVCAMWPQNDTLGT